MSLPRTGSRAPTSLFNEGSLLALTDLLPHLGCGIAHRLQFTEGYVTGHVFHAAIRRDHQPLRRDMLQPVADDVRDDRDRLDGGVSEVEHAEHDLLRG